MVYPLCPDLQDPLVTCLFEDRLTMWSRSEVKPEIFLDLDESKCVISWTFCVNFGRGSRKSCPDIEKIAVCSVVNLNRELETIFLDAYEIRGLPERF